MQKKIEVALIVLIVIVAGVYLAYKSYASGFRLFQHWESIGSPPEKIKELIGVETGNSPTGVFYEGRDTKIYVLSETGKLFSCCVKKDNTWQWQEESTNKSNEHIFKICQDSGKFKTNYFPDEISRLTALWCGEFDYGKVIYVLHSDGSVSYSKEFRNPSISGFALCVVVPFWGAIALTAFFILDKGLSFIRQKYSTIIPP